MIHFDFYTENLEQSIEHAKSCGATVCQTQFFKNTSVVMLDPVGHPFCLSTIWEEELFSK